MLQRETIYGYPYRTSVSTPHLEPYSSNAPVAEEEAQGLGTRVVITVRSYRKRGHDPDGISVKAVLDGIVRAGLLPDDSTKYVKEVRFKSYLSKEEKTVIEITADET